MSNPHRSGQQATNPYAHSREGQPIETWEPLPIHLAEVGEETGRRAAKFGSASLGAVLGELHDFGKFKPAFQRYLHDPKVTGKGHSTAGAVYATRHYPAPFGPIVAHIVAGHHAGLADGLLARDGRVEQGGAELESALAGYATAPDGYALPGCPGQPGLRPEGERFGAFQFAFLIRMLLSCLVDADRLCTARFYERDLAPSPQATIGQLAEVLSAALTDDERKRQESGEAGRAVNVRRADILRSARSHAADRPGVFTLTVPTGGGKTLTALDFALRHAEAHGLDRVIVVIPFTSVIEQSAAVYRRVLGPLAGEVLEHHSAFDEDKLRGEERQGLAKLQLAMENWDARVVVTTAVQFFESLFSNRPSQCRKLHNVARSVIVIDEAQTMPLHLLRPCVAALKELVRNYGVSLVLSTATQPALIERRDDPGRSFEGGFREAEVTELAPSVPELFRLMRRVTVQPIGKQEDRDLAALMNGADQALCIVGTRRHARELYRVIEQPHGTWHLSTMMHAAHRSRALDAIRSALKAGQPCRVVSTSLIEAGVDVDFPLVLRAETGLDQMAQSAGRLNREGRREASDSLLLVFEPVGRWVAPELAVNIEVGREMLRRFGQNCLDPAAIEAYFFDLYRGRGKAELDRPGVLNMIHDASRTLDFPFKTIAGDMRLIDSVLRPVIVATDAESRHWLGELENRDSREPLRTIARRLQRYTVGLARQDHARLTQARMIEVIREDVFGDQFAKVVNPDLYRPDIGLDCSDPTFAEAGSMIIGP